MLAKAIHGDRQIRHMPGELFHVYCDFVEAMIGRLGSLHQTGETGSKRSDVEMERLDPFVDVHAFILA
jgi:hypothetical protein